ncbi:MAG TPA: hypothetical protein V6D00_10145 [Pantanalinema sp.]
MRISSLTPLVLAVTVAIAACQQGKPAAKAPSGGGGGPGAAYNPSDQPAVNQLGSQGPVVSGGRLQRSEGGANAGAYGATPPEGVRGSGSAFNPHEQAQAKRKQFDKTRQTP